MQKILAVGCSFTRGHGLAKEADDPALWVNQICQGIGSVENFSRTGANNHWIFLEAATNILKNYYDIILVGWSVIPRFNFYAGLELYSVHTMLNDLDVNTNNVIFSGKWLKETGDRLRRIHNDHWDILDLIKYVNILVGLQETMQGGKIFFVNTAGPWSDQYFERKGVFLPNELSVYEQNLLQIETRDDEEIFALYNMVHSHYDQYGGICKSNWLNLYNSLISMKIDNVSKEDIHPGYQSQKIFTEYLAPKLKEKLI